MKKALVLLAGAAIGAGVTYLITKDYFAKIADAEIESVKEEYKVNSDKVVDETIAEEKTEERKSPSEKPDIMEYAAKIRKNGYRNYDNQPDVEETIKAETKREKPYVIDEDVVGTDDYDYCSLTYYADRVLCRDDGIDTIVEDIESTVGDALKAFADSDVDEVFVRDDVLRIDYEIARDDRNSTDVIG